MINVQVVSTSDTSLRISWEAPSSGGHLDYYKVTIVDIASEETLEIMETDTLFVVISELRKNHYDYVNLHKVATTHM